MEVIKRKSVNRRVVEAPCCGRVTNDPLCCAYDPRGHVDGRRRLPGDWCCWCGAAVKEGRSFCGEACSYSYQQDVLEALS